MVPLSLVQNSQMKMLWHFPSRPMKRGLTVYGTSRPRGVNKNAKTFRKQKQKQKRKLKQKQK